MPHMMPVDWGVGRYETTADLLLPAAETAVAIAEPCPGQRVLDIGCGTGNATLLAARTGATVVAVDPSPRLLDVARARAAESGLRIDAHPGSAAQLPMDDASIDVALSVFAVIFAPDPAAAAAEISRVLAPTGRFVMTAWTPRGAMAEMNQVSDRLVREALGAPERPPGFAWFQQQAVADLFAPHGFTVRTTEHSLPFTASSPEVLYNAGEENPIAVTSRQALEAAGRADELDRIRTESIAVLRRHNEDPDACRVTSYFALHVIERRRRDRDRRR